MLAITIGIAAAVVCLGCAIWWLTAGRAMADVQERLDRYGG